MTGLGKFLSVSLNYYSVMIHSRECFDYVECYNVGCIPTPVKSINRLLCNVYRVQASQPTLELKLMTRGFEQVFTDSYKNVT
jgi:hypothetical protein